MRRWFGVVFGVGGKQGRLLVPFGAVESGKQFRGIRGHALQHAQLGSERENGHACAGRNCLQILEHLRPDVDLVARWSVQSIQQNNVDGIRCLNQRKVGVDVGRQRRQLDLSGRCAVVLLKRGDGLRLAVFQNFEVFLLQAGNGVSFVVGDDDIDENEADLGLEVGGGVAGSRGRSLWSGQEC